MPVTKVLKVVWQPVVLGFRIEVCVILGLASDTGQSI